MNLKPKVPLYLKHFLVTIYRILLKIIENTYLLERTYCCWAFVLQFGTRRRRQVLVCPVASRVLVRRRGTSENRAGD